VIDDAEKFLTKSEGIACGVTDNDALMNTLIIDALFPKRAAASKKCFQN